MKVVKMVISDIALITIPQWLQGIVTPVFFDCKSFQRPF